MNIDNTKQYTKAEIIGIIDKEIKKNLNEKNDFIKLNGYKHAEILNRFDTITAAYTALYSKF